MRWVETIIGFNGCTLGQDIAQLHTQLEISLSLNPNIAAHPQLADLWIDGLKGGDYIFRSAIYQLLSQTGVRNLKLFHFLIGQFDIENEAAQLSILKAFSQLPTDNPDKLRFLLKAVKSLSTNVTALAAEIIAGLGLTQNVDQLEEEMITLFLTNSILKIRRFAIQTLSQLKTLSLNVVPVFEEACVNSDIQIRGLCIGMQRTLEKVGYESSINAFDRLLLNATSHSINELIESTEKNPVLNEKLVEQFMLALKQPNIFPYFRAHDASNFIKNKNEWLVALRRKSLEDEDCKKSLLSLLDDPTFPLREMMLEVAATLPPILI